MSLPSDTTPYAGYLRTLQIIVACLTLGLVFFLGIVLFLTPAKVAVGRVGEPPQKKPNLQPLPPAQPPIITYAAFAMAAAAVPASFVVPLVLVKSARQGLRRAKSNAPVTESAGPASADDLAGLLGIFQTQLIVAAALTEGPAFFALIAYMLERSPLALGLGVLLILGVAARFPTRAKLEAWLAEQSVLLNLERQNSLAGGLGEF